MTIKAQYKNYKKKIVVFMIMMLVVLSCVIIMSLGVGSSNVGFYDGFKLVFNNTPTNTQQIILNIRLPRVIAAVVCGWALAFSGCVMQVVLRNSLASPYTLGLSNAAAFGAGIVIVFLGAGQSIPTSGDLPFVTSPYLVAIGAFLSSMTALGTILLISKRLKGSPQTIILAGIIISSLFGAALDAIQYLSSTSQLASIIFWTFGNLGNSTWTALAINSAVIIPITLLMYYQRWNYRAVSAGDENAISLGVNPVKTRIIALTMATLCTSVVVSFFGVIAFIGLVVPHMMRKVVGSNEEFLLPSSAICGALFLLICDTLSRTIFAPIVIPVGIITSLVGAPIFLMLLFKMKKS